MPRKQPAKRQGKTKKGTPRASTAHTKKAVLEAVNSSFGLTFLVAQKLNVQQRTVQNYAQRWPEVAEAIAQKRGEMVDAAEAVVFRAVTEGDVKAAQWLLERLGKDRGYTERVELDHMGTAKLKITEVVVDRAG